MRLSFIEFVALLFTGLAGLATAVQAYVSWEDRGDVAKAIVFSSRIEACADLLATLSPITEKATQTSRDALAAQDWESWQPALVFDVSRNPGEAQEFARYEAVLGEWRRASSAFLIVAPDPMHRFVDFFGSIIRDEAPSYDRIDNDAFLTWLAEVDSQAQDLRAACRGLV